MSGSTTIACPAGFFVNDTVTPETVGDLQSAVNAATNNVNGAAASAAAAATSASAAAVSATNAAASANAAATSETNAGNSATSASSSATTATTQASNASTSATNAAGSATTATTQASNASTSATNASTSATNAANSATNAATSATNAANSATAAANSAASLSLPTPGAGNALDMIRINSGGTAYEARTPAQLPGDLGLSTADIGRNKLHNAQFNINQRGSASYTAAGYCLDRWTINLNTDTVSVTQAALADADRTGIGDEEAVNALKNVFTGNAAAGAFDTVSQPIESVRRLGGKSVVVSFYAKANSGTPKLGVSLDQNFGTGGSPSATVNGTGQSVTLSTSWARYTLAFTLGSTSGKTLGTNVNDYTLLNFWFSSGTTNATRAGSVGVQSNTVSIWGVQLEIGSTATPFEKVDPAVDWNNCLRFFYYVSLAYYDYGAAGAAFLTTVSLPTVQRTSSQTIGTNAFSLTNCTFAAAASNGAQAVLVEFTVTALGSFQGNVQLSISADL
jgi:hypothetical protein